LSQFFSYKLTQGPFPFKWHGWLGLGVMGAAEILLFYGVPFVRTFFTPLVWSGYILFIDAVVCKSKGNSLILNRRREFFSLLFLSVVFWLIFEFYNLYLRNWQYVGLPEELPWRLFGYVWAFATIWPAILLTAEALEAWREIFHRRIHPWRITRAHLLLSLTFGAFCLVIPLVTSPTVAHYLAAPVWMGFIFLLDPMNYWMGRNSLLRDLERGDPRMLYSLLFSGIVCGLLWEFWNYWAGGKWHYTLPILGEIKIFEMPVLGYLGFPPFAAECYVMYSFAKNIYSGGKGADG
jgi:hypothetical protein